MTDTLAQLPLSFWVAATLLVLGCLHSIRYLSTGLGVPFLAVLFTAGVWYVGDVLYNDYTETYATTFSGEIMSACWWQVAAFTGSFVVLAPLVERRLNRHLGGRSSSVLHMFRQGVDLPAFQRSLDKLFRGCAAVWVLLAVIAIIRLKSESLYYFFPFLSYRVDPWQRGRIGGGFDSLLSLAGYLQLFMAATFGVILALSKSPRTRLLAGMGCLLSWPYYFFGRARSTMLAVGIPAVLGWTSLRLRGGLVMKAAIIGAVFLLVETWFAFVITYRSSSNIATVFKEKGFGVGEGKKDKHQGIIMFRELCWINSFIADGRYSPNWGKRYFAEIVNPIPRSLWRNKPLIGIDYAVLRGQGGGQASQAGVHATISTGMIGQAVVNFGPYLGPPFAAFLMSLWTAYLARLDKTGTQVGHLPLYALGLILTFNLGRDITLLTLYPILFGAALIWWMARRQSKKSRALRGNARQPGGQARPPGKTGNPNRRHRQRSPRSRPRPLNPPERLS